MRPSAGYLILLAALIAAHLSWSIWSSMRNTRIAYVRSNELVYGYFGMKEAVENHQREQQGWRTNLDSLQQDLLRSRSRALELRNMGRANEELERAMIKQQQELQRYAQAMDERAKQAEPERLASVLDQINSFVERYAEANGYDLVLGTTDSGSLLYGQGGMDITQELLAALNKEHKGTNP